MSEELGCCHRCGRQSAATTGPCPDCGGKLWTATQTRRFGWAQAIVGTLLAAGVSVAVFNLAPGLLQPGVPDADGTRFTGSLEQAVLLLGVLSLVVVFGLVTLVNGVWQIRTGRRNQWILRLGFGLIVLVALLGWSLRSALGHG